MIETRQKKQVELGQIDLADLIQQHTMTTIPSIANSGDSSDSVQTIMNMRWGTKTQYGYKRCLIEFFGWLQLNPSHSHMLTTEGELAEGFHMDSFLEFCARKKKIDKQTGQPVNLSYSGMSKYRSALKYYFKNANRLISKPDKERLEAYFHGFKRVCAQEKQDGLRKLKEGKEEMPFALYKALAAHFYKEGDIQSATYLILTWNLCCRTNNTEGIKMLHIGWHRDALRIAFGLTKSNQDAERDEWRLIFANPDEPVICPITALCLYLLTVNLVYEPNSKLFLGGTPADTFHKALRKALDGMFFFFSKMNDFR